MFGPHVGIVTIPTSPAGTSGNALDLAAIDRIVTMVDAAAGVVESGGEMVVDPAVLAQLQPGYVPLITSAVARANLERAALAPVGSAPASIANIADELKKWGEKLGTAKALIENATTFARGADTEIKWWGPTIFMNKESATAFSTLLSDNVQDLLKLVAAVTSAWPPARIVSTVLLVGSKGLGGWVNSANSGTKGVRLRLYLWIVPAAIAR